MSDRFAHILAGADGTTVTVDPLHAEEFRDPAAEEEDLVLDKSSTQGDSGEDRAVGVFLGSKKVQNIGIQRGTLIEGARP